MSESNPEPEIEIQAPPVYRTPGRYASGKKPGPAKGTKYKRNAAHRTAPAPRTADDARIASPMSPIPSSRMPRETEAWAPEYDGPVERVSRLDRDTNQFELSKPVQKRLARARFSWGWKVTTVYNQPVDGTELLAASNAGWRPAKAKDFPEEVPPGTDPNSTIERFGQRLYIRPEHLTRQAQNEDYQFAQAQMQSRMNATQEGRSVNSSEESLSDLGKLVRPVAISLEVQGESGTHA